MKKLLSAAVLLLAITCFCNKAFSQKTIKGTITNDSSFVLAGVTVEVQNTTVSTLSDRNGNYVINAGDDAVLVFSFKGYATQEIQIHGRSIIDITMQHSALTAVTGTLHRNIRPIKVPPAETSLTPN